MSSDQNWVQWASYGHALARNLKDLRFMRGLSQQDLADLAGISRNQVSNLERNENTSTKSSDPVLSTVYKLARALQVPPAVLLPGVGHNVDIICHPRQGIEVSFEWPATEEDTMAFQPRELMGRWQGEAPQWHAAQRSRREQGKR
ncbi:MULTISPECIES: helix-turn-helix transcriptional regulator [unclassified Corynebacterium]|uniref:helix-turn-helix transcriptional regulator n=1 Tax=unclassified Corynebacterium TaxID=2624378 RepID=UPI0029CA3FFF|nr:MULTISPECIES: helix-turn-helix transcriptional regulator [unclassified Corynebacterium]WPF66603.1 helix-turn-helix transcriptional regulator [Corynebacterium sp. 22KM0430]WPF69091.1 helix-turn-helix transcriptional regulator [Corynebacterium sp. 21KM1197]